LYTIKWTGLEPKEDGRSPLSWTMTPEKPGSTPASSGADFPLVIEATKKVLKDPGLGNRNRAVPSSLIRPGSTSRAVDQACPGANRNLRLDRSEGAI
jgi:hypothetical protein